MLYFVATEGTNLLQRDQMVGEVGWMKYKRKKWQNTKTNLISHCLFRAPFSSRSECRLHGPRILTPSVALPEKQTFLHNGTAKVPLCRRRWWAHVQCHHSGLSASLLPVLLLQGHCVWKVWDLERTTAPTSLIADSVRCQCRFWQHGDSEVTLVECATKWAPDTRDLAFQRPTGTANPRDAR